MNHRGVILIVTVWILAILVLFVMGLGFRMSLEARLTDYSVNAFRLLYLAKAAVSKFEAVLEEDKTLNYDSLNEDWSSNEELFKDVSLNRGTFTISYIREEEGFEGEEEESFFYGAMDEASKININTMAEKTIQGNSVCRQVLWNLFDERDDIVNSVLDWIDEDMGGDVTRDGGAESDYYQDLDHPYACKNGPFQSTEELLLVRGMTPEIFNNIKGLITVYGEGSSVNFNTADSRVMKTLGLNDEVIYNIMIWRKGPDGEEGTSDDRIFRNTNEVKHRIPAALGATETARNAGIIDNVASLSSNHFRLHITAEAKDGKIVKRVEAVISRSEEGSGIKFWHEY